MATHQSRRNVLYLDEWIDGATIHTRNSGSEVAGGLAWTLWDHIVKMCPTLIELTSNILPDTSRKDVAALKTALGNFYLWGDGLRDGRLERVLEDSDDLKETVISILTGIGWLIISSIFGPVLYVM
jgi:hypothetical protein